MFLKASLLLITWQQVLAYTHSSVTSDCAEHTLHQPCNIVCGCRATTPPTLSHFSQCNFRFGPTQSLATFQREACLSFSSTPLSSAIRNTEENFCSLALGMSKQPAHTLSSSMNARLCEDMPAEPTYHGWAMSTSDMTDSAQETEI